MSNDWLGRVFLAFGLSVLTMGSAYACDWSDVSEMETLYAQRSTDSSPRFQKSLETLIERRNQCGGDKHFDLMLGLFYAARAQLPDSTPEQIQRDLFEGWAAVERIDASSGSIFNRYSQANIDLRKTLLILLARLSDQHQRSIPAFADGGLKQCPRNATLAVRALKDRYVERPVGSAPAYAAKIVEACPVGRVGQYQINPGLDYAEMLAANARAHLEQEGGSADDARTVARQARAALDQWMGDKKDLKNSSIGNRIRNVLALHARAEVAGGIDRDRLFSGDITSDSGRHYAEHMIAEYMSTFWDGTIRAKDDPDAFRDQSQGFYRELQTVIALARQSGQPDAIELLKSGLNRFATGDFNRTASEASFIAPPDVLWRNLEP